MKNILLSFFTFALFCMAFLPSCYYDNNEELHPELLLATNCDTSGITISYANDIVPILKGSCGTTNSCHQNGTNEPLLASSALTPSEANRG